MNRQFRRAETRCPKDREETPNTRVICDRPLGPTRASRSTPIGLPKFRVYTSSCCEHGWRETRLPRRWAGTGRGTQSEDVCVPRGRETPTQHGAGAWYCRMLAPEGAWLSAVAGGALEACQRTPASAGPGQPAATWSTCKAPFGEPRKEQQGLQP